MLYGKEKRSDEQNKKLSLQAIGFRPSPSAGVALSQGSYTIQDVWVSTPAATSLPVETASEGCGI
jgi:hypothetical protein